MADLADTKAVNLGQKELPVKFSGRKPRDVLCALLFMAYWIGMLAVAAIGFQYGDGARLIFATDYLGNTCGSSTGCGSGSCGNRIYYPRQGLDALAQGFDPNLGNALDIKLFGVCVDSCPAAGTFVCTYDVDAQLSSLSASERHSMLSTCSAEVSSSSLGVLNSFGLSDPTVSSACAGYMQGCWYVAQRQTEIFWRCLSDPVKAEVTNTTCATPAFQDENQTVPMPTSVCPDQLNAAVLDAACDDAACRASSGKSCVKNVRCAYETVTVVSSSVESSNAEPLAEQLTSTKATLARAFGDLQNTWFTVVVCGFLGAGLLGYAWLLLLQVLVGVFVWMVVLLSLVCMVAGTLFLFMKAGKLDGGWVADAITVVDGDADVTAVSRVTAVADDGQVWWEVAGIVSAIVTGAYFLIIIAMRRKLQIAIAIYKEASLAVRERKPLLIFPVWTCACLVALVVYSTVVFSYVVTAGDLSTVEISLASLAGSAQNASEALQDAASRRALSFVAADSAAVAEATINVGLTEVTQVGGLEGMLAFHFLGFLWTLQFILGVSTMTVATSIVGWYWREAIDDISVSGAYCLTMTRYFGVVAFGSLLIALVQFVRAILAYIDQKLKKEKDRNPVLKIVMCLLQCCMKCFEAFLKLVSRNAYVYTAMCGTGFCKSAQKAVLLLIENAGRVSAVHFIGGFIFTLSKVIIMTACVALNWLWLDNDEMFASGGSHEITAQGLTLFVTGLSAFGIATSFMHVYGIAVDTLLLCFCFDVQGKCKPYFMGESLKRFFKDRRRVKIAKHNAQKKNARVTPGM